MSVENINNKYLYFINGDRLAIVERNEGYDNDEQFISVSKSGLKIRIEYITRPLPFTADLTDSSEIPDQFHEAICYKVIADMYKLPGDTLNLQLAQYFDQQYLLEVREGKKHAARNKQSGGVIKPWSY